MTCLRLYGNLLTQMHITNAYRNRIATVAARWLPACRWRCSFFHDDIMSTESTFRRLCGILWLNEDVSKARVTDSPGFAYSFILSLPHPDFHFLALLASG